MSSKREGLRVVTYRDIVTAVGGQVISGGGDDSWLGDYATQFSTDTRTMAPGALLFALRGERFDAHDHLTAEIYGRSGAVVVSRIPDNQPPPPGSRVILVPDTLKALGQTATAWAIRCAELFEKSAPGHPAVRVGLSGSSGKTTTKEMLADILDQCSVTGYVTPGNLNNLIGLPQTMLALDPSHQAAILELGMNLPGEARDLVQIAQPTTLLLTNINNAHVGMFGTLEDLYQAECDSLRYAPATCTLIINRDDGPSRRAEAEYGMGRPVVHLSAAGEDSPESKSADWIVRDRTPLIPYGYRFSILHQPTGQTAPVELRLFGAHNIGNALAAAAVACDPRCGLGLDLTSVARALSGFRPRLNRSEIEECNGWWVIKDFYNAVPAAVEAALDALADVHVPGKRYALLTEMRELGELYESCHRSVGMRAAASALDHLFTVGDRARLIHEVALEHGIRGATHFGTKEEATLALRALLSPGDLILLKGARLVGLETVYQDLTGRDAHIH